MLLYSLVELVFVYVTNVILVTYSRGEMPLEIYHQLFVASLKCDNKKRQLIISMFNCKQAFLE